LYRDSITEGRVGKTIIFAGAADSPLAVALGLPLASMRPIISVRRTSSSAIVSSMMISSSFKVMVMFPFYEVTHRFICGEECFKHECQVFTIGAHTSVGLCQLDFGLVPYTPLMKNRKFLGGN
jgi:hypothetical protein